MSAVYGPPSDAYGWTRAACPAAPAPLKPAALPDKSGLTGWLDHNVEHALKASGLMHYLEKVTGDLDGLNAAAEEWQAQARAVQNVAEQLRAECGPLAQQWEGNASDAFGRHMGEVVEALDSTADGMYQTAQIISQAAQMCAVAEGMVIEIISEAIEALVASLAVEAVVTVLTLGLGAIAGAMLDAAEIAGFIARVARVSEELAQNLEKLVDALKELSTAVKAVRSLRDAKTALAAVKDVKTAFKSIREMEEGGEGILKIAKDAKEARSLDGVAAKVGDYAARQVAKKADEKATEWAHDEFKQVFFGDDAKDSADDSGRVGIVRGEDGKVKVGASAWASAKSFGGAMGTSAADVAKDAAKDDVAVGAYEGEAGHLLGRTGFGDIPAQAGHLLGDNFAGHAAEHFLAGNEHVKTVTEAEHDPAPYRVDKGRIEQAFG
ncbi:WXG100 family type VII secretion target [Kitasatospora sp. McL0602]|uniref:WXG100 family type VII secretion target n=1 Tax=Kitasatospora sp. McL0602 TaxID=3439530 RepID=UPI003F89350F